MEYELGELYLRAAQIILGDLASRQPDDRAADEPCEELEHLIAVLHLQLLGAQDPVTLAVVVNLLAEAPLELLGDVVVQRSRPYTVVSRDLLLTVRGVRTIDHELRLHLLDHGDLQAELGALGVRVNTHRQALNAELNAALR